MNRYWLTFFSLAMLCSIGCEGVSKATLFVDNDSDDSIRVIIDGSKKLYVGKGKHAKCHLAFGEHHIVVKRNGKTVLDQRKNFQPYKDGPNWRHYLLDPDCDTSYAVFDIYYYDDREQAKSRESARRVNGLARQHWVQIPSGATVLTPAGFTWSSEDSDSTTRPCVMRDSY